MAIGDGCLLWREALKPHASRLFHKDRDQIEVINAKKTNTTNANTSEVSDMEASINVITTRSQLKDHHESIKPGTTCIYILRQPYTWGRLDITADLACELLSLHGVFPEFLDCITCFGFRENDDDHTWEGFYQVTKTAAPDDGQDKDDDGAEVLVRSEICFLFRYMACNGRTTGSSWSLRQTAMYAQVDMAKQTTTWILIQPDTEALKQFLAAVTCASGTAIMEPSLALLRATSARWGPFTGHLRQSLEHLDEKACFSRVGRPSKADFEIRFSDSQELQKLRKKMLRTRKVLEASVDIVGNWEQLSRDLDACSSVRRAHGQAPFRPGYQQCRNLQSTLRYHLGIIAQLCDYSAHTEKLLLSILDFRRSEAAVICQQQAQAELASMRAIAALTEQENRALTRLAEEARQDTKLTKAVSVLAALYLPASLVASIFSSSLVQAQPASMMESLRLTVTSDIWMYFLSAGLLVLATLVYVIWLDRRSRRH